MLPRLPVPMLQIDPLCIGSSLAAYCADRDRGARRCEALSRGKPIVATLAARIAQPTHLFSVLL
jgi:hypothetical protein